MLVKIRHQGPLSGLEEGLQREDGKMQREGHGATSRGWGPQHTLGALERGSWKRRERTGGSGVGRRRV